MSTVNMLDKAIMSKVRVLLAISLSLTKLVSLIIIKYMPITHLHVTYTITSSIEIHLE